LLFSAGARESFRANVLARIKPITDRWQRRFTSPTRRVGIICVVKQHAVRLHLIDHFFQRNLGVFEVLRTAQL
jgi:hypothetical protein